MTNIRNAELETLEEARRRHPDREPEPMGTRDFIVSSIEYAAQSCAFEGRE